MFHVPDNNHFQTGKEMMPLPGGWGISFQVKSKEVVGFNSKDASESALISRFSVDGFEVS